MGMSADHSGPLEKELIATVCLVRLKIVAQVIVFKPQSVKFAEVPRDIRRIAECPLARGIHIRSIVELKTRRPVLIQFQLGVTIAAIRLLVLRTIVKREALAVGKELRPPRETLIN